MLQAYAAANYCKGRWMRKPTSLACFQQETVRYTAGTHDRSLQQLPRRWRGYTGLSGGSGGATLGCPAEMGVGWSIAMLEASIEKRVAPIGNGTRGSRAIEDDNTGEAGGTGLCTTRHADRNQARSASHSEDFTNSGDPPKKQKRGCRMILDLSHEVRIEHVTHPSVNGATTPDVAPQRIHGRTRQTPTTSYLLRCHRRRPDSVLQT